LRCSVSPNHLFIVQTAAATCSDTRHANIATKCHRVRGRDIAVAFYCSLWNKSDRRSIDHNAKNRRHEVSELIVTSAEAQYAVEESEHVTEVASPQPILITEQ
jgi:hypothetical protein